MVAVVLQYHMCCFARTFVIVTQAGILESELRFVSTEYYERPI